MHEFSLMADLLSKIAAVVRGQGATKVTRIRVKLGALSHISPAHFREHFVHGSRGTAAEGARLEIEVLDDVTDPHAQEILLESMEVETSHGKAHSADDRSGP